MHANEVRIATARPDQVAEADWPVLAAMLEPAERRHSARFAFQTDRRAYILAHALRRALVAGTLQVDAGSIRFDEDTRGKPILREPTPAPLHFSHSRSRLGVACAVTRLAPIGIDIEPVDSARADFELLAPYVDLAHEPRQREDFFGYWTALEAFWKACGTGLAQGNPRVRISRQLVRFESGEDAPCGLVLRPRTLPGCAIAVALRLPFTGEPVMQGTHCRSARDVEQLGKANLAHEKLAAA